MSLSWIQIGVLSICYILSALLINVILYRWDKKQKNLSKNYFARVICSITLFGIVPIGVMFLLHTIYYTCKSIKFIYNFIGYDLPEYLVNKLNLGVN